MSGFTIVGQRIDIGAFELGDAAVLEDLARQGGAGMIERGQFFQRFLIRARRAGDAGLALDRQFQLLEQHLAKLHQRADVEWMAGQRVNLLFDRFQLLAHVHAQAAQEREVETDAVEFQLGQHFNERHFHVVVELA